MMRSISSSLKICCLLSVISAPVGAWEIGLEQGESTSFIANHKYYTSSKYTAVTLREGPVEVIQGGWVGESYGRFIGVSGAYRTSGESFLDLSLGVVKLIDYSGNQLDGDKQFTFTIGVGARFDKLSVIVKVRHFSNGSNFFNGDNEKNRGMDFKMIYLGYEF